MVQILKKGQEQASLIQMFLSNCYYSTLSECYLLLVENTKDSLNALAFKNATCFTSRTDHPLQGRRTDLIMFTTTHFRLAQNMLKKTLTFVSQCKLTGRLMRNFSATFKDILGTF